MDLRFLKFALEIVTFIISPERDQDLLRRAKIFQEEIAKKRWIGMSFKESEGRIEESLKWKIMNSPYQDVALLIDYQKSNRNSFNALVGAIETEKSLDQLPLFLLRIE